MDFTREERDILVSGLKSEKERLIKARDVVEIGTVSREQLERRISLICDLIAKLNW